MQRNHSQLWASAGNSNSLVQRLRWGHRLLDVLDDESESEEKPAGSVGAAPGTKEAGTLGVSAAYHIHFNSLQLSHTLAAPCLVKV